MRKKTAVAVTALFAAATLTLSACGTGGSESDQPVADVSAQAKDKAATVLDRPFEKPDLVLKDTKGKEFDLRERTKGKPVLMYFGYTHCPDVCPLTMSNIADAKRRLAQKLPKDELAKLQVVFVTTDPERDTPAELGKWLKAQDPSFTGLTGDFPTIQAGARTLGISIDAPKKEKDGSVTSMHGKQVIAFSPKSDAGYVLYNGEEATADDYVKDLPKIIKGENP
ncbi:SCO family protein [Streptomyces sp. Da 82-17]|uniref:SCO family protein n=1 Tax=Streptomyces sp. Da 82-17 TaxID=3377116 RepID=UPI0038D39EDD